MTCLTETASGPSLRTVSSMTPGVEGDLVDRQVLDGRAAPLGEPRRSEGREEHDDPGHQRERDQPEQPEPRAARLRRSRLGVHQSSTSKKPIQPSSANSVLWAWNMYLPGYGNFSSRIPRCPCTWLIVSVYSAGTSDVPVGK